MSYTDRDHRLQSPRRITEIFETGLRAQDAVGLMMGLPSPVAPVRMAFAVGRRHGGAVQRNRIRRLCREAFRQVRAELPGGWDFVLVPHSRAKHSVAGLAVAIPRLARRVVQQHAITKTSTEKAAEGPAGKPADG